MPQVGHKGYKGFLRKTHCVRNHPLVTDNLIYRRDRNGKLYRACRECRHLAWQRIAPAYRGSEKRKASWRESKRRARTQARIIQRHKLAIVLVTVLRCCRPVLACPCGHVKPARTKCLLCQRRWTARYDRQHPKKARVRNRKYHARKKLKVLLLMNALRGESVVTIG